MDSGTEPLYPKTAKMTSSIGEMSVPPQTGRSSSGVRNRGSLAVSHLSPFPFAGEGDQGSGCQVLWEDGERVFCRGWRLGEDGSRSAVLVVLPVAAHPSPLEPRSPRPRTRTEGRAGRSVGGAAAGDRARWRPHHAGARGYRRFRAARAAARRADGGRELLASCHRHRRGCGQAAPARPCPQGHQAGQHSGELHDRRGAAHRVRHRLAPAARAPGARAARK